MDYEGYSIASESENLQEQINEIKDEIVVIDSTLVTLQSEIDILNQFYTWADSTAAGIPFITLNAFPYDMSSVNIGLLDFTPPGITAGSLLIPQSTLRPIMSFRFDYYGQIIQPYAFPGDSMFLSTQIGLGNDVQAGYAFPISDNSPRGVAQIVGFTNFHFTINVQLMWTAPGTISSVSFTERSLDTPNIPTSYFRVPTASGLTDLRFHCFLAWSGTQATGFQINLTGFQMRRIA